MEYHSRLTLDMRSLLRKFLNTTMAWQANENILTISRFH